jgi:hypothetical protein
MVGKTDLQELLSRMEPRLLEDVYVFCTLHDSKVPVGLKCQMVFEEPQGTTLILRETDAIDYGLKYDFPCRMITIDIHSSLEAVGFIARIATALAAENMGVNPVSGFYHDHLFVPLGREKDAMKTLEKLRHSALTESGA